MNIILKLFASVLNMSITASYVAFGVILVRIFLRKIPKVFSYALWAAVLFRLVCPLSVTSAFSFLRLLHVNSQNNTSVLHDIGLMQTPVAQSGIGGLDGAVNSSLSQSISTAGASPIQIWMNVLSIIWFTGIVVLIFYSVISYIKVKKKLITATLVRENIYESDKIETAFVCGFVHPKIYVPIGVGDTDLSYILEHERTHIRRKDYLIKPLAFFALILHWFNPLMWLSFTLMSRDMEMSCDESVLKRMNQDARGAYSCSLLSFSVKRKRLFATNPLAFGESHVKLRIKNILNYKKTSFWVIISAVIAVTALIVVFTTNPKTNHASSNSYLGYSIDSLIANKTSYVGNNSKVVGLIGAIPLPKGIATDTVELQTANAPYGIIINYAMTDSSDVMSNGAISGDTFYRNAVMLFSLIGNVDTVNCKIIDKTGRYEGASYVFTYTREMAENLVGEDVRSFAGSNDDLKRLIDRISNMPLETNIPSSVTVNNEIEKYLETIVSSPKSSSNPYDYIKAHQDEYESILKIGDDALSYLLSQFEKGESDDLKSYIMMALCKDLLGPRNNVTDETLTPRQWYNALSIRMETKLPNFEYDGQNPIEKLVYNTEIEKNLDYNRGGFIVVAPKIFGSYEEGDLLKVFVTTFSERYKLFGNVLSVESGGVVPAAITYRKNNLGVYILERYEQAKDGAEFSPSIKKFCTMPVSGKKINGLADKILKHYTNYDDIRTLLYNNLYKHLKKNGITDAVITDYQGNVEFYMDDTKYEH